MLLVTLTASKVRVAEGEERWGGRRRAPEEERGWGRRHRPLAWPVSGTGSPWTVWKGGTPQAAVFGGAPVPPEPRARVSLFPRACLCKH